MMLIAGWTLATLFGAGLIAVVIICRKPLADLIRTDPATGEIDLEQFEGDMRNAVRDINFGGRS